MKVELWAEIRRLVKVEGLTGRQVIRRLRCGGKTIRKALATEVPPDPRPRRRGSILDPFKPSVDAIIVKYPDLSAVRVREKIARGEEGYRGELTILRDYLRKIRPDSRRVYSEVVHIPGRAMQVDFGSCGMVPIGTTLRRVSVFVAVLCFSRLMYIEFTLSQTRAAFFRGIAHALTFFGGSVEKVVHDNLRPVVLRGSGRTAVHHAEFLAFCGHYLLEPIACEKEDPESKGVVEAAVGYVKKNALAGRKEDLTVFPAYEELAVTWRDETANVRPHGTTGERPVDRFEREKSLLRPLPSFPFDTDEVCPAIATSHARVRFDGNQYSVPPEVARKIVTIRADTTLVSVTFEGQEVARHVRCFDRRKLIVEPAHEAAKIPYRRRDRRNAMEVAFASLGPPADEFLLQMFKLPVKPYTHMRRILALVPLYGREAVTAALSGALALGTCDAAYVEQILLAERRRRHLPQRLPVLPKRRELLADTDLDIPDPGDYDRIFGLKEI
jgi:transposase